MQLTVQESRELLLNPAYQAQKTFEIQQRMANMYVQSTIVPQAYRGNIGNCVIAIDMAQRMQANPLMVMQNLYIVNGNPAWSSKFLISCINMSGRFTPLRYQFIGNAEHSNMVAVHTPMRSQTRNTRRLFVPYG